MKSMYVALCWAVMMIIGLVACSDDVGKRYLLIRKQRNCGSLRTRHISRKRRR